MIEKICVMLEEAKFPITDLKQGVVENQIQQTDDAVLYKRAIEIVQEVAKEYDGKTVTVSVDIGDLANSVEYGVKAPYQKGE